MTVRIQDSFTGANGTLLTAHTSDIGGVWEVYNQYTPAGMITANQAGKVDGGTGCRVNQEIFEWSEYNPDAYSNYIKAAVYGVDNVSDGYGAKITLGLNCDNNNNFGDAVIIYHTGQVAVYAAGVGWKLGGSSYGSNIVKPISDGDVFEIRRQGDILSVYRNDVSFGSWTAAQNNSENRAGIRIDNSNGSQHTADLRIDNLEAGIFWGAPPVPADPTNLTARLIKR